MNYRLIATDLDETLLNDAHLVGEENAKWIKKARKEKDVRIVAATGRGYKQILPELTQMGLIDEPHEYVISYNGACLSENKDSKVMEWHGLDFDKMKELFEFGMKKKICIHLYGDDELYIWNLNEDEKNRLHDQNMVYTLCESDDVDFMKEKRIAKILFEDTNVPYMMSFEEELKPITDGCVAVSYSSNRYMEFNTLGVDKGAALKKLAEKLSIPIEETVAIGDNYNDLAMLEAAGLSVSAGNAVEDVKKVTKYTTRANNNEGVVAEVIRKFIYDEDI